jgi:hypothetical protein
MRGAYAHQNLLDLMTLDGTPACIINGCSDMFLNLYSIAADHSVFSLPSGRKLPFSPFFKKGKPTLVNNYRSISTLNNFSKLPYFSIDNANLMYNAHPKLFRHSFLYIDNAHDAI